MHTSLIHLKIKIKSLAAEGRIIRSEETKAGARWGKAGDAYQSLHQHRVVDVRKACRSALLAYGFLRGRTYASMEASTHEAPDQDMIRDNVARFCPTPLEKKVAGDLVRAWIEGDEVARSWLKPRAPVAMPAEAVAAE